MIFKNTAEERFYSNVGASTTVTQDYVIPDGNFVNIREMGANSPSVSSNVKISFDPSGANITILATYGDIVQQTEGSFLGDGVKVIRITLTNNGEIPIWLGGYFLYEQR